MATKTMTALKGVHTSGIYSDMTVDGPEIGTLVVILDRAKNLPNRKTMGKQDPYCAARLGKEAKKTDTDKRGGQTPRWDQELRFTVHDSPDYYKLKVSVFNDDKKTELIGECWLSLEDIVVRGGGQNDLWHTLNCKGRYAGDIRIELTYYDIRPKDNKLETRQSSTKSNEIPEVTREGVGGPRGPKPMKRRPLPANPTESTLPSSLPQTPQSQPQHQSPVSQQHYADSPHDFPFHTPPQQQQYQPYQEQSPEDLPMIDDVRSHAHQLTQRPSMSVHSTASHLSDPHTPQYSHHGDYEADVPYSTSSEHQDQLYGREAEEDQMDLYGNERAVSYETAFPEQHLHNPQPLRYSHGHKQLPNPPPQMVNSNEQKTFMPANPNSISNSPHGLARQQSSEAFDERAIDYGDDVGPPPPPAHRESSSRSLPQTPQNHDGRAFAQASAASPLQIRNHRMSVSNSPLSQVHNAQPGQQGMLSTSPTPYEASHSQNSTPSRPTPSRYRQHQTHPPPREPMPPSLVAGYEPSVAADEAERLVFESPRGAQQPRFLQEMPREQSEPILPSTRQHPAKVQHPAYDPRAHRNSVPMPVMKAGVSNPDLRTPKRKSVSMQPGSAPPERSHSELPFSPDSFNAFNPNMESAHSINTSGAAYNTPDQAREASVQHDREVARGDGPIIGSDGRVIDPSDHLPADTWAPEPEQKGPKRGPEVTLRFKHSPQSPRPMPQASRRPLAEARPNAMPLPAHTQSYSADNSPASSARARLQKKSRMGMSQPNSSPIVPTLETTSPLRQGMPHHSVSEYPLRERENYAYGNSSPTFGGNRSPGGVPPPVPQKVPIGSGQEDWGNAALSEELKGIDIGAGSGHRARVRRYGF